MSERPAEDFDMEADQRVDFYDDQDEGCPECCDGEEPDDWQSVCVDDLCHGGEVPCMHGDYSILPCGLCGKRP